VLSGIRLLPLLQRCVIDKQQIATSNTGSVVVMVKAKEPPVGFNFDLAKRNAYLEVR
jgi:hypothetical protein